MTIAEALVRGLEQRGVDTVFGVPGTHTLPLYRALARSRIRHVLARHEQGAGFMADGYARASGRPGVCFLIAGPGLLNAATAIAEAWSDSVPLIIVSSHVPRGPGGRSGGYIHELPAQQATMASITAWSELIAGPRDADALLTRAFSLFQTGRPRPVHIGVPVELMDAAAAPAAQIETPSAPEPDPAAIAEAAAALASARRPIVIAGGGSVDAGPSIAALAERTGAGIMTTIAGKGVVPDTHPLHYGAPLVLREARAIVESADVVLAVGSELAASDTWTEPLAPGGRVIRIDVEAEPRKGQVLLNGPAGPVLAKLLEALPAAKGPHPDPAPSQLRKRWRAALDPLQRRHARVLALLDRALGEDGVLTGDTAQVAYTANLVFPRSRPRRYLYPAGLSTLGFALPVAIGAKLAMPGRATIALTGDYGFGFTCAELAVAADMALPLVTVVWCNGGLGQIRKHMQSRNQDVIGVDVSAPDIGALAQAYGCRAASPRSLTELEREVAGGLESDRPTVIEIACDGAWLDERAP